MAQIWAVTGSDGSCTFIFTDSADRHPRRCGNASACKNRNVWPLAREPEAALGEAVDHATGAIVFLPSSVLPALILEIKCEAARRIETIAPLWRQTNDLREPTGAGAARFAEIDAVRVWSNRLELAAADARAAAAVQAIRDAIEEN